jgi:ketosteroid isomerase-like protein
MSQENLEAVKRAYAALNRGDLPTVLGLCHPDVVFDNTNAAFDGAVYRGHEGIVEYFSLAREMWDSQRFELQEAIPFGEDQVVVLQRTVSVGRDGVETIARNANVFTLKQGKASHIKAFQTRADALEAVGLRGDTA